MFIPVLLCCNCLGLATHPPGYTQHTCTLWNISIPASIHIGAVSKARPHSFSLKEESIITGVGGIGSKVVRTANIRSVGDHSIRN